MKIHNNCLLNKLVKIIKLLLDSKLAQLLKDVLLIWVIAMIGILFFKMEVKAAQYLMFGWMSAMLLFEAGLFERQNVNYLLISMLVLYALAIYIVR